METRDVSSPKPPTEPPTSPVETVVVAVESSPDHGDQVASEVEEFFHELAKKHHRAK